MQGASEAGEGVGREGLLAHRHQDDVDAVGLDVGGGAHFRAAAAEAGLRVVLRQAADGDAEVHGVAGGDAGLATDAEVEGRADPGLHADADRDGVPVAAGGHVTGAAIHEAAEDPRVVGWRAAARVVRDVGEDERLVARAVQGVVDALVHRVVARLGFAT